MAGKITEQAIHQAIMRSRVYRLLSAALLYPDDAFPSGMMNESISELHAILPALLDGDGAHEALTAMVSDDFSPDALQTQYRQVFGHTISQECPPYETEYGSAHVFQQAQRLGDIAGFYRAFGVEVSDRAKERLDHIAVELEFMSFLTLKEAYALTHDGEEKASICRDAQRKFLEDHLGCWAPLFAELLSRKASEGFYRSVSSSLGAFITAECRHTAANPAQFHEGDVRPIPQEPEGGCFSCGMDDLCGVEPREET